jgi:XTP/dITP diphosphohydrolase
LREELGDLLLQVLMHAAIAQEEDPGGFDIGDIADVTRAKMIHRHPHVFGDVAVGGAADVVVNWEKLKRSEKRERLSLLDGVPHALPALAYAQGVQKRPARVGFDETPTFADAADDVQAALDAVQAAMSSGAVVAVARGQDWAVSEGEIASAGGAGDHAAAPTAPRVLEDAIGDLLFNVVALARRVRVNPEDALRERAVRFAERFRALERTARDDGVDLHDLDDDDWRRRWLATAPEP